MPYLRFSRDKRGYENTFVVHADRRRGGRSKSRILYWFRTPPGVKVGRAALDEDAIRLIEENNPDVEFDWTRILKGDAAEPDRPEPKRDVRPRNGSSHSRYAEHGRTPRVDPAPPAVDPEPQPQVAEPAAQPELGAPVDSGLQPLIDAPPSPAHARLGPEGVLRLRGRYAEILARIDERFTDPVRRDELKAHAERLNPDSWVTADEVRLGLDQYETVFESIRAVVGRRRHRRRRRRVRAVDAVQQPESSAESAPEVEPGNDPAGEGGDPDSGDM